MFDGLDRMLDLFSQGLIRDRFKPDFKQDGFPAQFGEQRFSSAAEKKFPFTRPTRSRIREDSFEEY